MVRLSSWRTHPVSLPRYRRVRHSKVLSLGFQSSRRRDVGPSASNCSRPRRQDTSICTPVCRVHRARSKMRQRRQVRQRENAPTWTCEPAPCRQVARQRLPARHGRSHVQAGAFSRSGGLTCLFCLILPRARRTRQTRGTDGESLDVADDFDSTPKALYLASTAPESQD